jgi:glycosyltransferase involved in cell wall biosynthesis
MPENMSKVDSDFYQNWTRTSLKRADIVIVPSEYVKNTIKDYYKEYFSKTRFVYHGVDSKVYSVAKDLKMLDDFREKNNLNNDYILYVGAFNGRKNIPALIQAFSILKKQNKTSLKLVLAGPRGSEFEKAVNMAEKSGLKQDVKFLGYVSDKDKFMLCNSAKAFVTVSLEEGFGLPVIEAMACGLPVIASNSTALKEIVGDYGLLVDPLNPKGIADAINKLLNDTSMQMKYRAKGLERAQNFTWPKTAEKTLEIYKEAYRLKQESIAS